LLETETLDEPAIERVKQQLVTMPAPPPLPGNAKVAAADPVP